MRLKKAILTAACGALLLGALTACGSDKETTTATATTAAEATTEAGAETGATEAPAASADAMAVSFNGVDIAMNADWNSVKDGLGAETKPADTIQPCDGGDYIQIIHYYDGLEVTTLRDETVVGLSIPMDSGSKATIKGIKIGDSADAVKSAMTGTISNENDSMISYDTPDANVMFYLENGAVTGAMMMRMMQ